MNPILISGFGTSIYVDKRKLVIHNNLKDEKLEFHPHQINHDSIVVDGHTGSITFDAIRWLMKHDINLTILNWNGNLLGVTLPKEPKAGKLKIAQYRTHLDSIKRFAIASEIVNHKILHTKNLLKELARYYKEVDTNEIDRVFANEERNFSEGSKSIGTLMNYEGRIATYYWSVLAKIVNHLYPEFRFTKRGSKSYSWNMNASDEINALLNYGYAILESEIRKCVNSVGLDPNVGFLHELAESKEPLVYDLQELLRWLVDLSVIQLLEEKKLKKSDFVITENYHIRLREHTAKALLEKVSLNFNRRAIYRGGKNFTYQSIMQDNVHQLANFLSFKSRHLQFIIPILSISRTDSLEIQQRIVGMSNGERKKRGISKSTLWYQKNRLSEGKEIKIYKKVLSKLD